MKIHHLNCGSLNPYFPDVHSLVYCLLVETGAGLILVDTGFGTEDYRNPSRKMRFFLKWMGTPRDFRETAIYQVEKLGFRAEDVKHIILTHLHIDHAGGLRDFPWADVHVHEKEYLAIQNPKGLLEYAYLQEHWQHEPKWNRYQESTADWFGFEAIPILSTPDVDFLFIPLHGHTRGHCGVAIGKPGKWLLHCGDAASPYHAGADLHGHSSSTYLLNFIPNRLADRIMGGHAGKLRKLLTDHGDQIQTISAHDSYSFQINSA